jgi:carbamoyl-phosphate synthase large subunit
LARATTTTPSRRAIGTPTPDRLRMVAQAMRLGMSADECMPICKIDPWFLAQIEEIVAMETRIREHGLPTGRREPAADQSDGLFRCAAGSLTGKRGHEVAKARRDLGVRPVYKRIDTCAAEFASPRRLHVLDLRDPVCRQPRMRGAPPTAPRS